MRATGNAKKRSKRLGVLLGVVGLATIGLIAGIAMAGGTTWDLTDNGPTDSVTVNGGAIFEYFDTVESDGTGVLHPYLRVQATGTSVTEAGYNSDYKGPQFDQVSVQNAFTDPILLSQIPSIEVCGTTCANYREIVADFNEANSGVEAQLSIDAFEIYLFDQSDTAFDVTIIGDPANNGINTSYPYGEEGFFHPSAPGPDAIWGEPDWYLQGHVLMTEEYSAGSGNGDLQILIPESVFDAHPECYYGSTECDIYFVNHVALGFYGELYQAGGETPPPGVNPDEWDATSTFEEFAVRLYPVLDVSKTLEITYEDKIDWTLQKSVTPDSHSGDAGDTFDSIWTVTATKTVEQVNYQASGDIVLTNNSGSDIKVDSIDDVLGGVPVDPTDVACPSSIPFVVANGTSVTCPYSVDLGNDAPTLPLINEVEVGYYEVNGDGTTQIGPTLNRFATATDDAASSRGTIGDDTVDLTDPRFTYSETIGGTTTVTFNETFSCSDDPADYTNGSDSDTYTNTAFLDGVTTDLEASADVTVTCTLPALGVVKTAAGFYDREVDWTLTKSVDDDAHSGTAGQDAGTSVWTVTATKNETLKNYNVEGTITITNSAAIAQTFTVSDVLTDALDAVVASPAVSCPSLTVAAATAGVDGQVVCTYDQGGDVAAATLNTATVSATGNADRQATAGVSFSEENVIGDDTVDLTDPRFTFDQEINATTTETFNETFSCSDDPADYTNGSDSDTYTNTAFLDGVTTDLEASDDVTVTCTLPALGVVKTAEGLYDRDVDWTLTKSVDDDAHTGFAGGVAGTSVWTVKATKTETLVNYNVEGTITITNSAAIAQTFTVSDVLTDAADAVVASPAVSCPSLTVAAATAGGPGQVVCTYDQSVDDDAATLNTATVSAAGNADRQATAGVSFSEENVIGSDSGTLSDDNPNNPNDPTSISGDTTWEYSEEFSCPTDLGQYDANGKYSFDVDNTATLNGGINLSDTESVTVDCYIPLISKTAAGTYDKTHTWDIEKSVNPASQTGVPGQELPWTWTVKVSETSADSNFKVAGEITLSNPNPSDELVVVITDSLNGTPLSTIGLFPNPATNCNLTSGPTWTLGPGETGTCNYVSTVTWQAWDDVPTQNDVRAHLNWLQPSQVAVKYVATPINWTANVINGTATVTDPTTGLDESVTAGSEYVYNPTGSHVCSTDPADYGDNGTYSDSLYNLATVTGSDGQTDTADATTNWTCNLDALGASKTAVGTYDRTVTWTLDKSVDDDAHTGFAGGVAGTSNWTVEAGKAEVSDNYSVEGTITVTNSASIAQSFTLSDVLDDGTEGTIDGCVLTGTETVVSQNADGTYTVPAASSSGDGSVTCSYTAAGATASATKNTATVTAPGNPAVTAEKSFTYDENVIGSDSGTLSDDNPNNPNDPTSISGDTTWEYSEEFSCPTDLGQYDANGKYSFDVDNTATLNGNINLSDTASVTVDCYIPLISKTAAGTYDETHTWDIEKSVDPTSQTGVPGDTLPWTWTVDVSETSADSNFKVAGVITLTNPNPDDVMAVVLRDTANGNPPSTIAATPNPATNCNLTADNGATWTLGPGETGTCNYVSSVTWQVWADVPTQNEVRAFLNWGTPGQVAVSYVATPIDWTANVINGTAEVDDDQEPDLPQTLTAGEGPWQWTETDSVECSTDRADYDEFGFDSDTLYNTATVTGSDGQSDSANADTTWTCVATFVDIYKTTNDAPADPSQDIAFALYDADGNVLETVSTLNNGADLSFQTALVPGGSYTICESPVPAGYTFEISVDGGNVQTYAGPPGEANPTGEIQCFDFAAPDHYEAVTVTFAIENSFPGGAPRTPGYWKNWSTCSGGNQVETAAKLGGTAEGVYLLDDLLPQTLGDFLAITTCEDGVLILEARDLTETNKKGDNVNRSSDAAYTLARALLAARLNQDAGACTAAEFDFLGEYGFDGTFEQLLTAADDVLTAVEFDGSGSFLSPRDTKGKNNPKAALAAQALYLYEIIDDYNNGLICTGDPSH